MSYLRGIVLLYWRIFKPEKAEYFYTLCYGGMEPKDAWELAKLV